MQKRSAVQSRGNYDRPDDHYFHVDHSGTPTATTTVLSSVPAAAAATAATDAVRRAPGHAAGIRAGILAGPEAEADLPEAQTGVRVLLRRRLRRPTGLLRRERRARPCGQETGQETFQAQQ